MSRNPAKHAFIAILSLFAVSIALSIGTAKAEDVTEDQILKALAPEKKPLTRSLSMGPPVQADPAAAEAEGIQSDNGAATCPSAEETTLLDINSASASQTRSPNR